MSWARSARPTRSRRASASLSAAAGPVGSLPNISPSITFSRVVTSGRVGTGSNVWGDAGAAYLERPDADNLIALKNDRPGFRRQFASDKVEDGRLAGAVRTNEAGDAACGDI